MRVITCACPVKCVKHLAFNDPGDIAYVGVMYSKPCGSSRAGARGGASMEISAAFHVTVDLNWARGRW